MKLGTLVPQPTLPLGVADDVVAALRVEVVVIGHVVRVDLAVHEVVVAVPGLSVQRLRGRKNNKQPMSFYVPGETFGSDVTRCVRSRKAPPGTRWRRRTCRSEGC